MGSGQRKNFRPGIQGPSDVGNHIRSASKQTSLKFENQVQNGPRIPASADMKAIKTCTQMQEYLYRPPDYCAFIREKFVDNKIIKEYELSLVAHVQGYARDLLH